MKTIRVLSVLLVFAAIPLGAQTIKLEDVTAQYDNLACNRIQHSTSQETFREQTLMKALYDRVLTVPADKLREAAQAAEMNPPDKPWMFFNPQRNALQLMRPPEVKDLPGDPYAGRPAVARYEGKDPVRICTGRLDTWNRQYFSIYYSFTVHAADGASLESVRTGAAPLKMRILHLEEKLPNAHDLYLNFTGILEP